jgi:hypothetical protein
LKLAVARSNGLRIDPCVLDAIGNEVAEENGIYLSNLTKSTQDAIVAMRLGGFR